MMATISCQNIISKTNETLVEETDLANIFIIFSCVFLSSALLIDFADLFST